MVSHRPRVLFFSNLFPDKGAPGRGIHNARVLENLAEHCDIRVISPRAHLPLLSKNTQALIEHRQWQPTFPDHLYIPEFGTSWNHLLQSFGCRATINDIINHFAPQVLLGAWLYPDGAALARVAEQTRLPLALIAQGSDVHQYLKHPKRRRIIIDACETATHVITRSKDLKKRLVEKGVPAHKVTPIYNGVDTTRFHPAEQLNHHEPSRFLFVGNLYEIKNPISLLNSFAQLQKKSPRDLRLTYIGDGPMKKELCERIEKLGLSSAVSMKGSQSTDVVAEEMRQADRLVVPSHNEGVPNVILEAFSCGLPVVATKVGGIPEILEDGQHGMLSLPDDTCSFAHAMGLSLNKSFNSEALRAHALTFSWKENAQSYLKIIEEMIATKR